MVTKIIIILCNLMWIFSCVSTSTYYISPSEMTEYKTGREVTLGLIDGTEVTLMGKAKTGQNNDFTGEYYYLPTGLRLASRPDGVPEFLFMKYTTEQDASAGGVQGALMHFLMQWGLTAEQEAELETKLKARLEE